MSAANPGLAVAAYLTDALGGIVEGEGNIRDGLRVFYPRLPTDENELMPWKAIVVSRAGGSQMLSQTFLPVVDGILDVLCYGSTLYEADTLADEAMLALQNLRTSKWEGVVLKWARIAAAPVAEIDTHTNWPESLVVVQVLHAREAA